MSDARETALAWLVGIVALLVLAFGGTLGGCAVMGAVNNWHRTQSRKNAENRVAITKINIQNEHQQALVVQADNGVVRQQAYQRYLQAVGIRKAQDEIAKTLTPLYVQHEAIEALQAIATSGTNNTVVYVPSGPNGVPLVQNATNPSGLSVGKR